MYPSRPNKLFFVTLLQCMRDPAHSATNSEQRECRAAGNLNARRIDSSPHDVCANLVDIPRARKVRVDRHFR
jgi:hypothetical protein